MEKFQVVVLPGYFANLICASDLTAPEINGKAESSAKCEMEVIWIPWNPVVTVVDVRIGVVPCPVYKFHSHDIVRNINEDLQQTS